jgi:DNA-binding MarR family transcriptional regulator
MTRSGGQVTKVTPKTASDGSAAAEAEAEVEAEPDRTVLAEGPAQAEIEAAAEAWRIVSDIVLDNERRRKVADSLGLSFGRARALRRVAKGPKPMGELADALGIDAPYLTLVVDDLERQGLVERRPHPTDRRVKLVAATRRGKDAARRAEAILGTPPEGLAALDRQDLNELVRILRLVAGPVEH